MKISVIVPFYNARETLGKCIESLLCQKDSSCEIIVVDNGSTDDSFSIAKSYEKKAVGRTYRVLREEKRGRERARNFGAAEATGEIFAFTDADCVLAPDWVNELKNAFQAHPEIAAVAGKVRGCAPENLVQKFLCLYTLRTGLETEKVYSSFDLFQGGFPAANLALRREMFQKTGGFNSDLSFVGGDFDLCAQIYSHGGALLYFPKAAAWHQHRRSVKAMMKQSYSFGGSQAVLMGKYFKQDWIVELPGKTFRGKRAPLPIWLNLTYLDKKIFLGLCLASLWWPLGLLLLAYSVYLMQEAKKVADEESLPLGWGEAAGVVGLMFLKSLAMTAGRVVGAQEIKGICL